MRNALGLMLASVVTALVISAVWLFWPSSSPRVALTAPNNDASLHVDPMTSGTAGGAAVAEGLLA